jgi:hypothetical protein
MREYVILVQLKAGAKEVIDQSITDELNGFLQAFLVWLIIKKCKHTKYGLSNPYFDRGSNEIILVGTYIYNI